MTSHAYTVSLSDLAGEMHFCLASSGGFKYLYLVKVAGQEDGMRSILRVECKGIVLYEGTSMGIAIKTYNEADTK